MYQYILNTFFVLSKGKRDLILTLVVNVMRLFWNESMHTRVFPVVTDLACSVIFRYIMSKETYEVK